MCERKNQQVMITPDWLLKATRLTCRERRSGRCVGAPGSWACASPGGSRRERWCGDGARRTPDPGTSRTAEDSSTPMRPSRRTDAGPETHSVATRVNHHLFVTHFCSYRQLELNVQYHKKLPGAVERSELE